MINSARKNRVLDIFAVWVLVLCPFFSEVKADPNLLMDPSQNAQLGFLGLDDSIAISPFYFSAWLPNYRIGTGNFGTNTRSGAAGIDNPDVLGGGIELRFQKRLSDRCRFQANFNYAQGSGSQSENFATPAGTNPTVFDPAGAGNGFTFNNNVATRNEIDYYGFGGGIGVSHDLKIGYVVFSPFIGVDIKYQNQENDTDLWTNFAGGTFFNSYNTDLHALTGELNFGGDLKYPITRTLSIGLGGRFGLNVTHGELDADSRFDASILSPGNDGGLGQNSINGVTNTFVGYGGGVRGSLTWYPKCPESSGCIGVTVGAGYSNNLYPEIDIPTALNQRISLDDDRIKTVKAWVEVSVPL